MTFQELFWTKTFFIGAVTAVVGILETIFGDLEFGLKVIVIGVCIIAIRHALANLKKMWIEDHP